ncbi:class I SAM-dependent methyltransferase [Streptomyces jeddahensis]|uniref:Trans-aconitate 2-methyltransferase n=1 Tax=Streptomyces jeddahensis TaxID=1716141 RepID=A0A177HKV7_9ACTN|nr:class I SAM-dependent methyltransferase [Streptomyces jeddahensis]OAH10864.1 trans-aconitate 2-methyltransferase [Streptomyces jeddahensis]
MAVLQQQVHDAQLNATTWDRIGRPNRDRPKSMEWMFRTAPGPGHELLGPLDGATITEFGCGHGAQLAGLADHNIARGIGIDVSPVRIHHAVSAFADADTLEWWLGDAVAVTPHLPPLDAAYSNYGAVWFSDPHQLLPRITQRLKPGGRLVFSCLTRSAGMPEGRRRMLVRTGPAAPMWTVRWMYSIVGWLRILAESGLVTDYVFRPTDRVNAFWGAVVIGARKTPSYLT